jgi:hypothetical protein
LGYFCVQRPVTLFRFFSAADQSRMMQEQMTMQAGGIQDPKQVILKCTCHPPPYGCQIFLGTIYQNDVKCTKGPQNVLAVIEYNHWLQNVPIG